MHRAQICNRRNRAMASKPKSLLLRHPHINLNIYSSAVSWSIKAHHLLIRREHIHTLFIISIFTLILCFIVIIQIWIFSYVILGLQPRKIKFCLLIWANTWSFSILSCFIHWLFASNYFEELGPSALEFICDKGIFSNPSHLILNFAFLLCDSGRISLRF